MFEFWALPHQIAPRGDWSTWVIMGGRGAGKTRAGAEWVRNQVEGARPMDKGKCQQIALVGETYAQARDVMVFGDGGILACCPPDRRPKKGRLLGICCSLLCVWGMIHAPLSRRRQKMWMCCEMF